MSDVQRMELGPIESWREYFGGFVPARSKNGRRVLDHELPMQFIGVTANSMAPGEEAGYWHAHSSDEELYIFLTGRGQMGLDDEVLDVGPGTVIRVGQGVMRTWRCAPDGTEPLTWFCIRGDGGELPHLPDDAHPITDRPMPW
ncbi:cupin domain-containing protein [Demequina globuliformis]|uniref:cupin domain-containing protein n=1 Tax=Demequina globuliformis TaxID=676202 RepID=UPI000780BD7B|nr:cupin domain-containing protein [Demequina globuliformis]